MSVNRQREWRELNQRITTATARRAYQIHRQPWRWLRNKQLRREIDLLMYISDSKKVTPSVDVPGDEDEAGHDGGETPHGDAERQPQGETVP